MAVRRLLPLVLLVPLLGATTHEPSTPPDHPVCAQDNLHPLDIEVTLEATLVPNEWIPATITVTSAVDLESLTLDLQQTAGVRLLGATRLQAGTLASNTPQSFLVQVMVPDRPDQEQVWVVARGQHEGQELRLGTTLNLLPHGPHHPGVPSAVPGKHRTLVEYPGAAKKVQ